MMSDAKTIARKVGNLRDNMGNAAERSMEVSLETVVAAMKAQLRINDSIALGLLHDNLRRVPLPSTGLTKQGIIAPDYWKYLEFGTGIYTSRTYSAPSGGAPVGNIYAWILEKGITPRPDGPAENQYQLASVIANSITTGTESHPFARPVWRGPFGRQLVVKSVERALQNEVDRAF